MGDTSVTVSPADGFPVVLLVTVPETLAAYAVAPSSKEQNTAEETVSLFDLMCEPVRSSISELSFKRSEEPLLSVLPQNPPCPSFRGC
jgi:hypothetical protein